MSPADELLQAWEMWDRNPRAEWAARRMVDASHDYAHHIGTTTPHLRRQLAAARRQGRGRSEAIAATQQTTRAAA